jgi:ketosteroid isomerase-like protein
MTTQHQVEAWIEKYVHAWTTAKRADIEALFAPDAEYHEQPYDTEWTGRDEIVAGWLGRQQWQEGGWTFTSNVLMITGDTAAVQGTGVYTELGTFDNLWVITLEADGRCSMFRMWNNERPD